MKDEKRDDMDDDNKFVADFLAHNVTPLDEAISAQLSAINMKYVVNKSNEIKYSGKYEMFYIFLLFKHERSISRKGFISELEGFSWRKCL